MRQLNKKRGKKLDINCLNRQPRRVYHLTFFISLDIFLSENQPEYISHKGNNKTVLLLTDVYPSMFISLIKQPCAID